MQSFSIAFALWSGAILSSPCISTRTFYLALPNTQRNVSTPEQVSCSTPTTHLRLCMHCAASFGFNGPSSPLNQRYLSSEVDVESLHYSPCAQCSSITFGLAFSPVASLPDPRVASHGLERERGAKRVCSPSRIKDI